MPTLNKVSCILYLATLTFSYTRRLGSFFLDSNISSSFFFSFFFFFGGGGVGGGNEYFLGV